MVFPNKTNKTTKIVRLNHCLPPYKDLLRALDPPRRGAHPYTPCMRGCTTA